MNPLLSWSESNKYTGLRQLTGFDVPLKKMHTLKLVKTIYLKKKVFPHFTKNIFQVTLVKTHSNHVQQSCFQYNLSEQKKQHSK